MEVEQHHEFKGLKTHQERIAFAHGWYAALESKERRKTVRRGRPRNTGSPKLPLMRFEVYARLGCSITEDEGIATKRYREIVNDVYDLLERQLRACEGEGACNQETGAL